MPHLGPLLVLVKLVSGFAPSVRPPLLVVSLASNDCRLDRVLSGASVPSVPLALFKTRYISSLDIFGMVLNLFDNPEIILIILKVSRRSSIILDGETISHVFFNVLKMSNKHQIYTHCALLVTLLTLFGAACSMNMSP